MAITSGTYTIRSAMDPSIVLDVEGNSSASGANIELWSENGGLNQVWDVQRVSSTYCKIVSARSGLLVDSSNAVPVNGKNIMQYRSTGGHNQQWAIEDSGQTIEINGASYPLYCIKTRMDTGYCIDASGARSAPGTNVILWQVKSPYALNQLWVFMPTSIPSARLQAPSSGGISASAQTGGPQVLAVPPSTSAVYPSWVGNGSSWQVRYRTASRGVSASDAGAWSAWKCLADGSTANEGWGAVGTVEPVTASGGRIRATHGIPIVLGSTNDKVAIRFEARRFEQDFESGFDAHGTAGSFSCSANTPASVSVSALEWSPDGLSVTPVPSNGRGGNAYAVLVEGLMPRPASFAGVAGGDSIVIGDLSGIPSEGGTYTVRVSMTTADGVSAEAVAEVECSYADGRTLSVDPPVSDLGTALSVDLSQYPVRTVYVAAGGRAYRMRDDADGITWAAPPLGMPYEVYAVVRDANGEWGSWSRSYPAIAASAHVLTYEGGTIPISANRDEPPLLNVSGVANLNAALMSGGVFEAVTAGEGRAVSGSLSGVVGSSDSEPIADALEEAVFCWYQGPRGQLWRIAVESTDSTQQHPRVAALTIGFRRTDD